MIYLFILLLLILHILRAPYVFLHPNFWAEDGLIFFADNYELGKEAIFKSFAGHHLLYIRICSYIIGHFPIELAPRCYVLFTLLTNLFLISLVLFTNLNVSKNCRLLMITSTQLISQSGESFLNLSNTFMLSPIFVILLILRKNGTTLIKELFFYILFLIFLLSGPGSVILSPILIYLILKQKKQTKIVIAYIASIVTTTFYSFIHINIYMDRYSNNLGKLEKNELEWIKATINFINPLFLGYYNFPPLEALLLFFIFIIILFIILFSEKSNVLSFLNILSTSHVLFLSSIMLWFPALILYSHNPTAIGPFAAAPRYFYAPYILILWSLILSKPHSKYISGIRYFMIFTSFTAASLSYCEYWKLDTPTWEQQLQEAKEKNYLEIRASPAGWNKNRIIKLKE